MAGVDPQPFVEQNAELEMPTIFNSSESSTQYTILLLLGIFMSSLYYCVGSLGITDLYQVNVTLVDVVHIWKEIGLALGLKQLTLERIASNYLRNVECCLTEAIAVWLNGEDRSAHDSPGPSWGKVIIALKSVNKRDQAHQLFLKLKGKV